MYRRPQSRLGPQLAAGENISARMITGTQVVFLLLEACPSARPRWEEHLAWWKGEDAGAFNDVAVFAHHIVDSYSNGLTDEYPAFFAAVERILEEGDEQARRLASIGALEDIQTISTHRTFGPAAFVGWLGPKSRAAWDEIDAVWRAGGGSLMGVVRLERGFDLQPILDGELVQLRPLRAADFADLFAVAADPLIWEQHPAKDRHNEDQFRMFFRESLESGGALIAIDRRDGRIIGSSRFHGYDRDKSEIEIGWTFLARSHWGGRYNGEMKRLMLQHAFRFVDRVILIVGADNLRSQRAVEKIGGVRAGSRPDNAGRESILYEITAAQYGPSKFG